MELVWTLTERLPELYEEFRQYYRQDPAARSEAAAQLQS